MKYNLKNIVRALKLIWQSSPCWSIINFLFVVLRGIMPLMLIFIVQQIVDEVGLLTNTSSLADGFNKMVGILLFAALIFSINAILNSFASIVSEKHTYFINDTIQNLIHKRTTVMDYTNFDDYSFHDIYFRAVNEASYRPAHTYYSFIGLVQNGISLVLIAGLLAVLHWVIIVSLILVSFLIIIIRLYFSRKIYGFKRTHTENERVVGYYNRLLTGKEFAKELRVFNLASLFKERYEKSKNDLRRERYTLLVKKSTYELLVQFVITALLIFIFGFIANETIHGNITQGGMVMCFLALYRGYNFLQGFLGQISGLYEDGLFLKNFFEFLDYDIVKESKQRKSVFPSSIKKGISIKDVSFKYPNSSRSVFEGISFDIAKGETVAIVGANGAGKSTLIKLICGLYQPDSGSIYADEIELSDISSESLAKNITVVFQDFMLYNLSARENIWLGDIAKDKESPEIESSAQKSGIHSLLIDLPRGYETHLGTLFKDSEMLSVGEWQRMALSRSFFNDAQLVVLDEPTSSMDAQTESLLVENFKMITKNRTSIIVSHRMSTIQLADKVIFIGEKGVIEEGFPEVLMNKRGAFFNMVQSLKNTGFSL
ncbi:ABC transporter ATP-binding protein [Plebeiibacterium sediminum]|uniref:ABC transporter ATP-binding protein/permease n=1 Tax=Plebeiibacterium sediminum TaxID=2992112 RepID=A0AAE3M2B8_9BACT|nr:ABC transporter ATP-binding protein [Plebeiobacterium sediminum]MCW3785917.1 ABC transporter ATP-binding protein/permease [Plebeiobacterium sediminum]